MSIVHTVTRQYKDRGPVALITTETPTGNAENNLDDTAPIAANHLYSMAFTRANLQSITFSIVGGPVTVYTNNPSGSSPQDTIVLAANQTLVWTLATDAIGKCPFSGNVTAIYVTNASAAAVPIAIRSVLTQ